MFSLPICGIMELTKSLPPGGRWHAERDGRSLRDFEVLTSFVVTRSPSVAYGASPFGRGGGEADGEG